MSWFSRSVKDTIFDNRGGRLSVDEYVEKINQSKAEMCAESEHKLILHKELVSVLQSVKASLKEKGLDVDFKEIVDNIYIPEIEVDIYLPEVSFIFYKNTAFQVDKDDSVFW